jgi:hypothetical protein
MKTVMSGAALAAILALAMPVWAADTSANPSPAQPSAQPPAQTTMPHAKKGQAAPMRHARHGSHRAMHHASRTGAMRHHAARSGGSSPTDNMANQLNRAEAQKLSGTSAPPSGTPNMAPMGAPNQPRPMQGQ